MTNFKIVSPFFENISLISQQEITNKICTIHINSNKEIKIPLLVAVSFSNLISQMLLSDALMTDFYINDSSIDDINDSIIDKLSDLMNLKEIQLENEEIVKIAKLGKILGNCELLTPFKNSMKELEHDLNEENAIALIKQKISFDIPIEELQSEVSFVASNFTNFVNQLIELGSDMKYQNVIEGVVKHEKIQLEKEDDMLLFILKLCEQNNNYELLFQYVWLEYCSVESISIFIQYVNEKICKDNHLKSIIRCINRRLVQDQMPITKFDTKRYNYEIIEYNADDPLNGILRQEYLKNNADMRTSSTGSGDVYDLLKNSIEADFYSNDEPNSWIEGSLKNKKLFSLTKYVIRGRKTGSAHLKSWKLEGHRISDGNWIELDSHQNEPFDQLVLKVFPINSNEKFDTVRLTQTGKTTVNTNYLNMNAFDIFGKIYTN